MEGQTERQTEKIIDINLVYHLTSLFCSLVNKHVLFVEQKVKKGKQ